MCWKIALILFVPIFALAETSPNYFLLTYSPGGSWNSTISYEEQPGLKKHHEYLQGLYVNDQLVMGGPVTGSAGEFLSVMLLRTGSLEEAEKLASQDPGVQMKLVKAEVIPWSVDMSSMRFVRRKPQPPVENPDQPFTVKRIDLESRLNLEDTD